MKTGRRSRRWLRRVDDRSGGLGAFQGGQVLDSSVAGSAPGGHEPYCYGVVVPGVPSLDGDIQSEASGEYVQTTA